MLALEARTRLGDARAGRGPARSTPASALALAGPSGAGKTTLLRIVAGPAAARTRARCAAASRCGSTPRRASTCPPERRRVGYLFQDYALFPNLSAWRNVAYGIAAAAGRAARPRAASCSSASGWRRTRRRHARPRLSGGERQRVALARALAREPAGAAAGRAAVGARRAHARRRRARAGGAARRGRRAGAAGHARLRGGRAAGRSRGRHRRGRVVQIGHGGGAGGRARVGVRRRPHRRGGADRHGHGRAKRPDRGRARRRRHGDQHRRGRRARWP